MMKKFLILILTFFTGLASHAEIDNTYDFVHEGIRYRIISEEERTVETRCLDNHIVGEPDPYDLPEDEVILPSKLTHNGKEYTLVKIGDLTFARTATRKFVLPKTVEELGSRVFESALVDTVYGMDNVRFVGTGTFYGSNIREIVFSDSIQSMGGSMFALCFKLGRVEIPANDTHRYTTGTYFFNNSNPYEIKSRAKIPPTCGTIGYNWEQYIPKNTWVVVPSESMKSYLNHEEWSKWSDKMLPDNYALDSPLLFKHDGLFFSKIADSDNLVAIVRPPKQFMERPYGYGIGGTFKVPSKASFQGKEYIVHAVGGFMDSEYEEIILPPTVKVIDRLAFTNSKVKRINAENIMEIRQQAFHSSNLENIKLSDGVNISTDATFYDCKNLTKVDLPAHATLDTDGNIDYLMFKLFGDCINLDTLICRSAKPYDINLTWNSSYDLVFQKETGYYLVYDHISPTVWVPKGAVDTFREAWGKYTDDIRELEEEPVSVAYVNVDKSVSLTVTNGYAHITGVEGAEVSITSVSGQTVFSSANASDELNMQLPHGVYILSVNGTTTKFTV